MCIYTYVCVYIYIYIYICVHIHIGIERKKWDFKAFVEANRGVLRPAALNFFYCNGD